MPKLLREKAVDFLDVDNDIGMGDGGLFADIKDFFEAEDKKREKKNEDDGFKSFLMVGHVYI